MRIERDAASYILRLHGAYGLPYQLETSTDLIHWQPMMSDSMSSAEEVFELPTVTEPKRFYRMRSLP
jgi:hypothetical protein